MNKNAKLSMMARRRRKDGILESCENGYFSDKETYFEGGKSVYCKGGYFWEVENYDDCWYICLNVPV